MGLYWKCLCGLSAYDVVNPNVLVKWLISQKIMNKIAFNIMDIFQNQSMYVNDQNGVLHEPRLVQKGLPQGAVLNLYCSMLILKY